MLAGLFFGCSRKGDEKEAVAVQESLPEPMPDWRDANTCRSCHEAVYESWMHSHHAGANRMVELQRDREMFAAAEVVDAAGRQYTVGTDEEGHGLIDEHISDEETREGLAVAIIGKTPLEQPLVEGPRGRWQAHTMAWDVEKKEWFNVFGGEERIVGEWGHWTGQGMNWNSNCAWCHMTEYEKNYDLTTDSYASTWSSHGISCVSCHSGMEAHVENALLENEYVKPDKPSETAIVENCASCHSRRELITDAAFEAGDRYEDHFRLTLYDHPTAYFPDKKADEEDFVYGSFVHSKMGHAGVSCLDCHNPHTNELKLPTENNALCIQCHSTGVKGATIVDIATHSRHEIGGGGDSCVECHMPARNFMARDPRHDHGFTIPDPLMTKEFGTPNACTKCHAEVGNDWLVEKFDAWFGQSERVQLLREEAHLLTDAWQGELSSPDSLLKKLESEENVYWQASWLKLLGRFSGDERVKNAALPLVDSEAAIVRDAAMFLLGTRSDSLETMMIGLRDDTRMVRMRAASVLAGAGMLEGEVLEEYRNYLEANADRPFGALGLAELSARERDVESVKKLGELAISFDRRNAPLRYEVAILFDRVGLLEEAIKHLRVAHGYDNSTGLYVYSTGLIQAEMGNLPEAQQSMLKGLAIEPNQDRWLFNLAVIQARSGNRAGAIQSLERALEVAPETPDYQSFLDTLRR